MPRKFSEGKSGAAIAIRVTPRAKKNEIMSVLADNTIKIKLAAPPIEGKANKELLKFLAKVFGVKKKDLEIVAGKTGRDKLVTVIGLSPEEMHKIINEEIVRKN